MGKKFKKKHEKQSEKELKKPSEPSKFEKIRPSPISWIVFFFTISMVILSLIPVVFPSLIVAGFTQVNDLERLGISGKQIEPYEAGPLAGALFVTSGIVFGLAILHFKNKLPQSISKGFQFIFNFEVSKKVAIISMVVILAIYVAASANELAEEEQWEDYIGVKQRLETWSPDQITNSFEPHVNYFLISSSMILFGNYAVVPFLASIALVIMVYFFTKQITNKRFAGIVAAIILLQSNVFLTFDTSVAYTNFWILFYLLSLYFMYKAWLLSPVSYIASIPAKALTVTFLPMSIYFLLRCSISRKKKMIISGAIIGIVIIGATASSGANLTGGAQQESFISDEFWIGFASFATQLRFDVLVILFLIPLVIGLLCTSTKNKHAESMMVMIGGMLLIAPFLTGFSDQTNQPYRFVPFVTFFAVGVGILLSKTKSL
ncbi:MAG TPA: hypothetical protein ENH95_03145 [Nitrosopumilus sp.]|nr:hypothetical protein [Nitrosopumilus sp.]